LRTVSRPHFSQEADHFGEKVRGGGVDDKGGTWDDLEIVKRDQTRKGSSISDTRGEDSPQIGDQRKEQITWGNLEITTYKLAARRQETVGANWLEVRGANDEEKKKKNAKTWRHGGGIPGFLGKGLEKRNPF